MFEWYIQIIIFIIANLACLCAGLMIGHTAGKKQERNAMSADLGNAIRELEEIEARQMNAEKATKFRVRTAESDPNKKAVVHKAKLRAIRYKRPDPRR